MSEGPRQMAPAPYSFLPAPKNVLIDPTDPPTKGWWRDPLDSTSVYQRYYDGTKWTEYVRSRTPKNWTQIFRDGVNNEVDPGALGIPRPPAVAELSPHPPTPAWWEDPIEPKLKQARYFDGSNWTAFMPPTMSMAPRSAALPSDPTASLQR